MSTDPLPRPLRRIVLGPGEDSVEVVLAEPVPDPATTRLIAELRAELDRINAARVAAEAEVERLRVIIRMLQGKKGTDAGESPEEAMP